jgi:hypothetical protein
LTDLESGRYRDIRHGCQSPEIEEERKEGKKEIVTNIAQRSGPWQKETGG